MYVTGTSFNLFFCFKTSKALIDNANFEFQATSTHNKRLKGELSVLLLVIQRYLLDFRVYLRVGSHIDYILYSRPYRGSSSKLLSNSAIR